MVCIWEPGSFCYMRVVSNTLIVYFEISRVGVKLLNHVCRALMPRVCMTLW